METRAERSRADSIRRDGKQHRKRDRESRELSLTNEEARVIAEHGQCEGKGEEDEVNEQRPSAKRMWDRKKDLAASVQRTNERRP